MTIFISHSFDDKDQFDNIADALDSQAIPYWRPSEIVAGAMLSDQLRDAIGRSRACVFIATRNSVNSSWCSAELGAFWGAGKPVLIFVADTSLKDDKLPKQFQGHYLEKRITKLMRACKEVLEPKVSERAGDDGTPVGPVDQLSRDDFVTLIESAIERVTVRSTAQSAFSHLSATLESSLDGRASIHLSDPATSKAIQAALYQFLGLSITAIQDVARTEWPHRVSIMTTAGRWDGFAQSEVNRNEDYLYGPCVLFRYDDNSRVAAAAFTPEIGDYNLYAMQARHPVTVVGRGQFGTVQGLGYVTEDRK
jgi:hypothetical protein